MPGRSPAQSACAPQGQPCSPGQHRRPGPGTEQHAPSRCLHKELTLPPLPICAGPEMLPCSFPGPSLLPESLAQGSVSMLAWPAIAASLLCSRQGPELAVLLCRARGLLCPGTLWGLSPARAAQGAGQELHQTWPTRLQRRSPQLQCSFMGLRLLALHHLPWHCRALLSPQSSLIGLFLCQNLLWMVTNFMRF